MIVTIVTSIPYYSIPIDYSFIVHRKLFLIIYDAKLGIYIYIYI